MPESLDWVRWGTDTMRGGGARANHPVKYWCITGRGSRNVQTKFAEGPFYMHTYCLCNHLPVWEIECWIYSRMLFVLDGYQVHCYFLQSHIQQCPQSPTTIPTLDWTVLHSIRRASQQARHHQQSVVPLLRRWVGEFWGRVARSSVARGQSQLWTQYLFRGTTSWNQMKECFNPLQ